MATARTSYVRRALALLLVSVALTNTGCAALLVGAAGGAAGAGTYHYLKSKRESQVFVAPAATGP